MHWGSLHPDAYQHLAAAALEAADKVQPTPGLVGFVIVDIKTRKLDWDGELHPTREAAIESLTGPHQMWCSTPEESSEERTYYGDVYEILPVSR